MYRYRLKLIKNKELRFISHLDWQSLILKIFRRLELKLVLSEGFNKMPKVSYSSALPLFIESECELVNFQTYDKLDETFGEITDEMRSSEPKSLENYVQWAKYEARLIDEKNHVYNSEKIRYIIEKCLSSDEFLITKKTKKGIEKTLNYRKSIHSLEMNDDGVLVFILKTGQNESIPALRADDFLKKIFEDSNIFRIKRIEFFDTNLRVI